MRIVEGQPRERREVYDVWAVVTQDCDLAWNALIESVAENVELRPVTEDESAKDWGIRNKKFLMSEAGEVLNDELPRLYVAPAVVVAGTHLGCLDVRSARRLKTWLGLRYDRPAIPGKYGRLASDLAKRLRAKRGKLVADRARDVLARFWTGEDGGSVYELVAVLPGEASNALRIETESWLGEVVTEVPIELGVVNLAEVRTDKEISLAYIEASYSLDVSYVSWPANSPGPVGEIGNA